MKKILYAALIGLVLTTCNNAVNQHTDNPGTNGEKPINGDSPITMKIVNQIPRPQDGDDATTPDNASFITLHPTDEHVWQWTAPDGEPAVIISRGNEAVINAGNNVNDIGVIDGTMLYADIVPEGAFTFEATIRITRNTRRNTGIIVGVAADAPGFNTFGDYKLFSGIIFRAPVQRHYWPVDTAGGGGIALRGGLPTPASELTADQFYTYRYKVAGDGTSYDQYIPSMEADSIITFAPPNLGPGQNPSAAFLGENVHRYPGIIVYNADIEIAQITLTIADPTQSDPPPFAPSTDFNNMIGSTTVGYQMWFNTDDWHHWSSENSWQIPGPGDVRVELWPAGLDDYRANGATLHNTGFTMPDGSAAQVFHSKDPAIILTHHQWMRDAEIDGPGIQRFYRDTTIIDTGDTPNFLSYVRDAAEATGRIFYAKYDMSGSGDTDSDAVVRRLQLDWIYNVENKGIVSSPNYAQAEGKPVVMFKGLHSVASSRYASADAFIELILWFRSRGYYVIGGIHENVFWGTGGGRHPRSLEMYRLLDMISPWHAGRAMEDIFGPRNYWLFQGMEFCRENLRSWADNKPIAYMPVFWPGFAWTNMTLNPGTPNQIPRFAGQRMWNQVREYLKYNANNEFAAFYLAMFDEYDESTALMKAGTDFFDIPLEQYFKTFAVDGTWLSSDYYLRLAQTIIQTIKNAGPGAVDIGPLNQYSNGSSSIVPHSLGPVFWRNSFERRTGRLKFGGGQGDVSNPIPVHHLQLDVGVPHGAVIAPVQNITVSGAFTVNRPEVAANAVSDNYTPPSASLGMVYASDDPAYSARSGESAFRLAGQRTAGEGALYRYKIADTRIKIESGMILNYWINTNTASLGTNVLVDLLLDNGVYVSASASAQNTGTPQDGWQHKTLALPADLNDRYITAVIIAYRDTGTAIGNFAALIDDISIDK